MQEFYTQIEVKNVYQSFNYVEVEELDGTYKRGSNCLDSISVSQDIMQYVESSKLLEINEVVHTDYQSYLIDINFKQYFDKEFAG